LKFTARLPPIAALSSPPPETKEMLMAVQRIRDEGQTLSPPTGKLVGIIDTRADFDKVVRAVQIIGPISIEALCGEEGVNLLERVNTFFFSDMEDRVLQRHIEELKAGHIVALIKVPEDRIDEAAKIATQNGARRLVYFGFMTVTWLTK
jgi:hypothetical protein